MFDIREELKKLPETPGCYLHKDASGTIIYVGKAVSLRRRVRQYFQSPENQTPKVRRMVKDIVSFETINCKTEVDALILECKLIKELKPKYNILLRDDKSYPYIKLTLKDDYPRIVKTHRVAEDGCRYFGPYPFVATMDMVIELMNTVYRLKRCPANSFPESHQACLNYHIHSCDGCCLGKVDKAEYAKRIEKVLAFLDGDASEILDMLRSKMQEASDNLEFEQAAAYRDYISAVKEMNGMLRDPEKVKDAVFADMRKREREAGLRLGMHAVFGEALTADIHRIEAYDISHIGGIDMVGAMVAFVDGKPCKTAYRRYKIKTVKGANDTACMQEVLARRFRNGEDLPDLILMDGGAAQVNAALDVLKVLELDIPVAGMVKDSKHRTANVIYRGEEQSLKEYPALYAYFGTIQEEVHRFAIAYHHALRSGQMVKSELDKIPGIGEKRKLELLSHFGSVDKISGAGIDELAALSTMGRSAAESVYNYFQQKNK